MSGSILSVIIIFHLLATDFSDDEGEESEKDNEEPEEWGKFLHLKERVRTTPPPPNLSLSAKNA